MVSVVVHNTLWAKFTGLRVRYSFLLQLVDTWVHLPVSFVKYIHKHYNKILSIICIRSYFLMKT
jgi:hypothetical protein